MLLLYAAAYAHFHSPNCIQNPKIDHMVNNKTSPENNIRLRHFYLAYGAVTL